MKIEINSDVLFEKKYRKRVFTIDVENATDSEIKSEILKSLKIGEKYRIIREEFSFEERFSCAKFRIEIEEILKDQNA